MTTQNTQTEPAGAVAPQAPVAETTLADSDAALDAELGFDLPGDNAEPSPEVNQDPDPEVDPDPSDDPAETPEGDPPEGEEADDPNDDPDPAEGDEPTSDEPDFSSIPKEHQSAVGKLISKARTKERSKTEAKITELSDTAEQVPVLEKERAALQGQLDDLKAAKSVPAPTEADPYANITTVEELTNTESLLWDHRRELMANPDDVQITDPRTGEPRYLEDGEAQRRLAAVDERLQRYLPQKRKFLEENAGIDQQLVADYPDLERDGSELKQSVNRILAAQPHLKLSAGYRRTALAQAIGEQVLKTHGKEAWAYGQGKPGKKLNGKSPATPAKPEPRKKAPTPPAARTAPRRNGVAATPGKFSEDAYDAELGF